MTSFGPRFILKLPKGVHLIFASVQLAPAGANAGRSLFTVSLLRSRPSVMLKGLPDCRMTNGLSVIPHSVRKLAVSQTRCLISPEARPYSVLKVTDREGNVLEENRPEPKDAIRADTAFVMTNLLQGVVQRGTAAKAAALKWPIGGKTGTTDDYTDAWFIGFDPDITIGVWVGYDQKRPIGPGATGAETALPIWIDIMKAWIGDRKEPPAFDAPGNIVFLPVDRLSGAIATVGTPGSISEAFIAGTQPGSGFR